VVARSYMDENAYIVEALAGVLYLPVAARLLWRAARTRRDPERLLGATFGLYGLSYILFELPALFDFGAFESSSYFLGRVALAAGSYLIALFTRRVFRPRDGWAEGAVLFIAFLFVAGLSLSALQGDWDGSGMHQVGFWLEWIAQLIPCVWVCAEGAVHYTLSERRRGLGLSDIESSHRFLFWSLFGCAQTGASISVLAVYIAYARDGYISAAMDATLGGFELVSIAVVWLVFYPPTRYRRWLERVSGDSRARETR
jgi:hypothetical protein